MSMQLLSVHLLLLCAHRRWCPCQGGVELAIMGFFRVRQSLLRWPYFLHPKHNPIFMASSLCSVDIASISMVLGSFLWKVHRLPGLSSFFFLLLVGFLLLPYPRMHCILQKLLSIFCAQSYHSFRVLGMFLRLRIFC